MQGRSAVGPDVRLSMLPFQYSQGCIQVSNCEFSNVREKMRIFSFRYNCEHILFLLIYVLNRTLMRGPLQSWQTVMT